MPTTRVSFAALLVAAAASGCATSNSAVRGRNVTLVPAAQHALKPTGELLAVDQGRIWLRTKKDGVHDFDVGAVREVRVERHGLGGGKARRIGLIGGFLSGIALSASCSSVEGNSSGRCAAWGFGIGAVWALVGLAASPGLDASAHAHVSPNDLALRAFARFPAGLPKDVPLPSLAQEPRSPRRRE